MNINLGAPYEALIERLIERGYAGNHTEIIRQALMAYDRQIEEEEVSLVHKAVQLEMQRIESGEEKTIPFAKIKAKYNL